MNDEGPGLGELLAWMTGFVVVGAPLFFFVWQFINELLLGRVRGSTALAALVALAFLAGVLAFLARRVRMWEAGGSG